MSVRARPLLGVLVLCGLLACARVGDDRGGARVPIDHIVVLFLENRSFDHLFGTYPGAEGLAAYRGKQAGENGVTYATLPRPLGRDGKPDPRFPSDLPNAPFPMLKFVGPLDETDNPVHRFYHMQRQYGPGADGIPMGKWVAEGTSGGTTMGYYERAAIPVQWRLAKEFVLLDNYFQGIHGGSFANHFYLIAATLATYPDAPAVVRAELAPDGGVVKDGDVDPEGRVVNNLDPPYPPQRVPNILQTPQTAPTIADRLDAAGVSWRWYATGWGAGADAVKQGLMPHHNPFQYVQRIMESPYWSRVAVVITYDEGGGWFDHVPPPVVDPFGLGTRVPTLIVSPYAKRGVVAHGLYDHASILKLIEWRFGLEPLTERDRRAAVFLEAFDFGQRARPPVALP